MKKKIGIATVYTGFNYGSSLQAFATKTILSQMGCEADILKIKGSLIPGRDIRIKKLMAVILRSVIHSGGLKSLKNYGESISKVLPQKSKEEFNDFAITHINPRFATYSQLKAFAQSEYDGFLCGSDQVWNSAVFYVDPFYYLQFAPCDKRVAFAPSFGRDFIPDYNKKIIKKYISEIPHLSVRESSGVPLIEELTGKKAEVLIDPTLVLNDKEWTKCLRLGEKKKEKYILAYFLDTPSEKAIDFVEKISEKYGLKIISLPYEFENFKWNDYLHTAGPKEFCELVKNAEFVCTDSFHGTAFSLNFNIPFFTFERNYNNAGKQSARIQSILQMVSQTERYEPESMENCFEISFEVVNKVLEEERNKSKNYLRNILGCIETQEPEKLFKNNILSPHSIRDCTGCGMCQVSCPTGAITVKETEDGFYKPVVDDEKCTDCSLCQKVCYKFDSDYEVRDEENYLCFSAVNKNEQELKTASSGGVSAELMREALKLGYCVVGVAYDILSGRAVTKIARSEDETEVFKGSKYFQSYTVDAFKEIISDKSEQQYAIFGTPCQIYALSKMAEIKKNRDKYLFVDIFCHGCPSLKLWDKYSEYIKKKKSVDSFEKINFRSKAHGWHEYCFDFKTEKKTFSSSKYDDPFHEIFFSLDAMNKACYDCVARSTVEKTDIRMGDFWGKRFDEDSKGVSAVVISTEKGQEIFNNVKDKFTIQEADFHEIINAQSYKKIHRCNERKREKTLSMLSGDKNLEEIVKEKRKEAPFSANLKRVVKKALKHLPQSVYFKIKTKIS